MSRIEQLIAELCPDGVEFKELSEVAVIGTGSSNGNEATVDGKYPLFVRSKIIKRIDAFEFDEEAIIIPGEGGIGEIFHYINGKYALHQRAYRIHVKVSEISTKFLCYYMMSNFKEFILQKAVNATVSSIRKPMIAKFPIPIPPLPIQQEIVRILDTFTDLDAELQAELEARKKQYEHYRNQLLNFEGKEVEWIPFEDCFEMKNGYTPSKSKSEYWNNGTIPWFRMEDIRSNGKILSNSIQKINQEAIKGGKLFPANSIIIATSATIGEHALITTEYLSNQRFTCYYPKKAYKEKVNMKYMYYYSYLLSEWCKNNTNVSGFASVDMTRFRKLQIPLPPVSEQERIVSILDKFEALVNEELSAEIDARRKQYEYYREKLLAFEPLVS